MHKLASILRSVRLSAALVGVAAASLLATPAQAKGAPAPGYRPEAQRCFELENGISGTLRVDFMFYATTSPALVVVTLDEDFERLASVLRCKADGSGVVRITGDGVDWKLRLKLDGDGVRLTGYCHGSGRRIYVTTSREAPGYWQ
jgi:hypothetical protein